MKLNAKEIERIIDDLSQCERRDRTTMSRPDYTETSRRLATERQKMREPLLTKLRLIRGNADEVEV